MAKKQLNICFAKSLLLDYYKKKFLIAFYKHSGPKPFLT